MWTTSSKYTHGSVRLDGCVQKVTILQYLYTMAMWAWMNVHEMSCQHSSSKSGQITVDMWQQCECRQKCVWWLADWEKCGDSCDTELWYLDTAIDFWYQSTPELVICNYDQYSSSLPSDITQVLSNGTFTMNLYHDKSRVVTILWVVGRLNCELKEALTA